MSVIKMKHLLPIFAANFAVSEKNIKEDEKNEKHLPRR